jgi:hypothetical protein
VNGPEQSKQSVWDIPGESRVTIWVVHVYEVEGLPRLLFFGGADRAGFREGIRVQLALLSGSRMRCGILGEERGEVSESEVRSITDSMLEK